MQPTNWSASRSLTEEMAPEPSCAGRPVRSRSVATSTQVRSEPFALKVAVTVAAPAAAPRRSRAFALTTRRRSARSARTTRAVPSNTSGNGPNLILTAPW